LELIPEVFEIDEEQPERPESRKPLARLIHHVKGWLDKEEGRSDLKFNLAFALSDIAVHIRPCLFRGIRLSESHLSRHFNAAQINFNARQVRLLWRFPTYFESNLHDFNEEILLNKIRNSPSIALYADIRRSQELMLYTAPSIFQERMSDFIRNARQIVRNNGGIFDKFTGDGFLAFFNDGLGNANYPYDLLQNFLNTTKALRTMSQTTFAEWPTVPHKAPKGGYGLSMGADFGLVHFDDDQKELMAIGSAIVWANRMCTKAKVGEFIVNNELWQKLRGIEGIKSKKVRGKTKSGERFVAYLIKPAE